nr:polymerase basic 2 [Aedes orthomyxo-like virus 2]
MNSANQGGFDKKGLLALAEKIVTANQGTINILKNTPLCNLKTVQRNAKNLKDPAPLQSMIAVISTKYPLSVDSAKAAKYNLPSHLLDKNDAHQYGRRRCKMEAVGWFLEHVPVPNDDIKRAVDILFRAKREEVKAHYEIPWARSTIRFGKTCLLRQLVPTQEVVFKVPLHQRVEYLMTALMPHLSIMYPSLDPAVVEELKVLTNLNLDSKLTIQSQLRILLNMMDSKPRYMPALPEYPHTVNRARYTIASANHLIVVPVEAVKSQGLYTEILIQVGKVCWYLLDGGKQREEIREVLQCCTFRGVVFHNLLSDQVDTANIYLKLLFAVMGLPIFVEKIVRGFNFTPIDGDVKQEIHRNKAGRAYACYIGKEKIQVRGEGFIANVTRFEDTISRIVLQKCDYNIFVRALAAICVYLKIGFSRSYARNIREMEHETFEGALENPGRYLGMSTAELQQAWSSSRGHDKIAFEDYIEPTPRMQKEAQIWRTSLRVQGGQDFKVQRPTVYPLLPLEFRCTRSMFNDFMAPPRMLSSKIAYYVYGNNYAIMMEKASRQDWNWLNQCIMEGIEPPLRIQVALNARYAFDAIRDTPGLRHYQAYLYCLSHYREQITGVVAQNVEFRFYNSLKLSLYLTTPDAAIVEGEFRIAGSAIARYSEGEFTDVVPIFLRGFRLLENYDGPARVTSITRAIELTPQLPAGAVIKVFLFGREYCLERDLYFDLAVQRTIAVRTTNANLPTALLNLIALNKRVHDEAEISTIPIKRARVDEQREKTPEVEDTIGEDSDIDADINLEDW